jgi:hypothetical protein
MLTRHFLAVLGAFAVVSVPAALAEEPQTKLSPIVKQPAYRSKAPAYCLLVLGEKAKTNVWLVFDEEDLYIDRNANGDLTEKGEKVACKKRSAAGNGTFRCFYQAGSVTGTDGETKYQIAAEAEQNAGGQWGLWAVSVLVNDKYVERCILANLTLGIRPDAAPVLHFGGPLAITVSSSTLRFEETDLRIMITGKVGQAMVSQVDCESVPKDVHPVADIEFPHKVRDKGPIRVKVTLNLRC